MAINRSKLLELGACEEATEWIGDKEYPYTADGVRAALAAGAESEWLEWLFIATGCGDAAMWELAGVKVITEDVEVTSGFAVCLAGSPAVTVSGGEVRVFGDAKPTITVSGSVVDVCGKAKPAITMSGGWVGVYGRAEPAISVSSGWVGVFDDAEPTIAVSSGDVWVSGDAKPTITVSGGKVCVFGSAKPIVRREDGTEIEPVVDTSGRRIYRVQGE